MHKLKLRFLDSEPMFFAPESRIQQKPYWCCFLLRGGAPSLGVFGICLCFLVFGPLLVTLWAASVFCFLAAGAFWTGLGTLFSALLHGPLPKSGMCICLPATLISAFCPQAERCRVPQVGRRHARFTYRARYAPYYGLAPSTAGVVDEASSGRISHSTSRFRHGSATGPLHVTTAPTRQPRFHRLDVYGDRRTTTS